LRPLGLIATVVLGLISAPAAAQSEVDLELVLAVDVSRSMEVDERLLQRDGYVSAFRHPEVIRAIERGLVGRIVVTYVEWAGPGRTRIVVPWTVVANERDAEAFASVLSERPPEPARGTSISGGLDFARSLFDANDVAGLRSVIDMSGDGPNNMGRPVTEARDEALAEGIIINGLVVRLAGTRFYGYFDIPDLDLYYEDCVIGGPGSFVIPVDNVREFEIAIRRKLVLEIAGLPPRLIPAQFERYEPVNCLIGEMMRARRFQSEYER
jgi:hypothetical protein